MKRVKVKVIMANFVTLIAYLITIDICHSASSPSSYHLERQRCQTSNDCKNPFKECIDGLCFCKPEFDDVLEHGERDCMLSHGTNCSENSKILCNVHKHLVCDREKRCTCYKSKSGPALIYDEQLETCVALPGDICEFELETHVELYEMTPMSCVPKAECCPDPEREIDKNFFGVCKCSKGHVKNGEGKRCVPQLGSKCQMDSDCDNIYNGGVVCVGGKCQCDKNRVYEKKTHRCTLKVGEGCELEPSNCVEGASCILISKNDESKGKYKWGWECSCNISFHEDKTGNGTCVKDKLEACGEGEAYDKMRGRCSIKVGNKCKTFGMQKCTKHSYCSGTSKTCQCFAGYKETEDNLCEKEEEPSSTEIPTTTALDLLPFEANRRISTSVSCKIVSSKFIMFLFSPLLFAYNFIYYIES